MVAVLLHKAIGHRLHCIFVDNGLLRLNEGEEVVSYLRGMSPVWRDLQTGKRQYIL